MPMFMINVEPFKQNLAWNKYSFWEKKHPTFSCSELQKVQEAKKLKSFYCVMEQSAFTNRQNFGSLHFGPRTFTWLQQCLLAG